MKAAESLALISYRLERSRESLRAAEIMFENSMLTFSMNRVYYAMFYAVQALLVTRKVSFSKHGQVKAYFNREIIKTGIFPTEMGRLYNKAFEYRQKFDYVDFSSPDREMISEYLEKARGFISNIQGYLQQEDARPPKNAKFKDLTPDPPDLLLDEVIEKNRKRQEELRLWVIEKILAAIDKLSEEIDFNEAYLFGSVTKPFRFSKRSDIDIGFVGLDNRHFFKVMSYISEEAGRDVDIVQLEDHRLADKIKKGGIRWKRKD